MNILRFIMLALLAAVLPAPVLGAPPETLFIFDDVLPDEVRRDGGFIPPGFPPGERLDYSLYNHMTGREDGRPNPTSVYVRAVPDGVPLRIDVSTSRGRSYLYHIRPSYRFFEVNLVLGRYNPIQPSDEYASLGTIPWRQVIGWQEVRDGVPQRFVPNGEFSPEIRPPDSHRFFTFSDYMGLAGWPPGHPAWQDPNYGPFTYCNLGSLRHKRATCTGAEAAEYTAKRLQTRFQKYRLRNILAMEAATD